MHTAGLRNKKLTERAVEANRLNAVLPPSQEAIRRALEANLCPWCGKGPYASIAGHTVRVHGIDRLELRDMAGLLYSASITSEELRQKNADRARQQGPPTQRPAPGHKRNLSRAAREANPKKLEATRSAEQRAAATAAAHTPEVKARRSATLHARANERLGPPVHGTRRMYRGQGCRCDTCRAWNTEAHRRYLDSKLESIS